jgi:hypothetical protein
MLGSLFKKKSGRARASIPKTQEPVVEEPSKIEERSIVDDPNKIAAIEDKIKMDNLIMQKRAELGRPENRNEVRQILNELRALENIQRQRLSKSDIDSYINDHNQDNAVGSLF